MNDLVFIDHGSIWLVRPQTDAGREWLDASTPEDRQEWCGATVVEPRYVHDIALGAVADGLTIGKE